MPTVAQQLTPQKQERLRPDPDTILFKECPLALEAVQELLSLGVRGAEVASLMINIHGNCAGTEWLVVFLILSGFQYYKLEKKVLYECLYI